MTKSLDAENRTVFDVTDPRHGQSVCVFLEAAAAYNQIDKAIQFIPREKWGDVLLRFGEQIDNGSVRHAVALADIMKSMPDKSVRQQMEQFVQEKYAHAPDGKIKDSYGVLASYYNSLEGGGKIALDRPDFYKVSPISELPRQDLLGKDGLHRQLVVFSDDPDAHRSYDSFIKRYEHNPKYHFEDKGTYIKITPVSDKDTKMEIYANKPGTTPKDIIKGIGGDNATVSTVEFDAVIHRGHSYNLDNTLPWITSDNSLMFIGSCGGYQNIDLLLKISPNAQIISTKETGAMAVNDPLLYHMNESIRQGKPIQWEHEQKYLNSLGSEDKAGYLLPHNNTALLMQAKLNELDQLRDNPQSLKTKPSSQNNDAPPDSNVPVTPQPTPPPRFTP